MRLQVLPGLRHRREELPCRRELNKLMVLDGIYVEVLMNDSSMETETVAITQGGRQATEAAPVRKLQG